MNTASSAGFYRRLPSARKIWLNLHLWLGLTGGLVLALIGVTGSMLVFTTPLLRMELGQNLFALDQPAPAKPDIDGWIANARRAYGDVGVIDFAIGSGFGLGGGNAPNLGVAAPDGKRVTITFNPDSGLALAKFALADTYTFSILRFHTQLSSYLSWGRDAVAWLGVAMIVSMATGLYLWWPRNGNWYSALTLKRDATGRRRLLELHNLFAVYLYIPLLVLAFTGVYFIKPHWIDPVISLASVPRTPDPEALARTSKPGSCSARTTPSRAAELALARFPTAKFVLIVLPRQSQQPYRVQLAPPNNLHDKGQTLVFVDRECPLVLTAIDGEIRVASEVFKAVAYPLHRNLMLGSFGSAIVLLAGLLLPLSFVTGLLLWLGKRRNRVRPP